jgi:general secretion pathway protein I
MKRRQGIDFARSRKASGFTLLEVMLAFVLLVAALGLLIGMLSNGLRLVRQAQDETAASLYAQSLLEQLGALEPLRTGVREGELAEGRYRYRLQIAEIQDPAPIQAPAVGEAALVQEGSNRLLRVELRMQWGNGLPGQQLRWVTLRAATPAADAADDAL